MHLWAQRQDHCVCLLDGGLRESPPYPTPVVDSALPAELDLTDLPPGRWSTLLRHTEMFPGPGRARGFPALVWVFSRCSGFLPQPQKHVCGVTGVGFTGDLGVIQSTCGCVSVCGLHGGAGTRPGRGPAFGPKMTGTGSSRSPCL